MLGANSPVNAATGAPSAIVRPSAAKNAAQPAPQTTDFSFYKSVGAKSTDADLSPPESAAQAPSTTAEPANTVMPVASTANVAGGYFVQVAAVSRQEDAAALVEALKKKQYPAFTANNSSADKFYHVQVGPYADMKEAEGMRARLIADGYNPIVKK